MKRKLLSILMMIVMALSIASCGTKDAVSGDAVKAVIDKMSATEVNGMSMVFEMNMDDEDFGLKMDVSGDDKTSVVTMDLKMNIDGMKLDDYVRMTDCIVADETFYVNVKAVFDFLAEIDPQYAILASYVELPGDYVGLTLDDVTELYSDVLGVDIDFAELMEAGLAEADENDAAYSQAVTDVVCRFIEELAAKDGSGLTVSGDKISGTVNEKTLGAFMKALASIDVEEYCMQYAETIDKIEGGVDYTAAMQKEVKGLNDKIKEAATDLPKFDDEKMDISFSAGVEGKSNVVAASVKVKDDIEDVGISLSVKTSPDKTSSVSVPDSVMTYEEFMNVFGY